MCGIVAYAGAERQDLGGALLAGLAVLEYRGYDSAGIALAGRDGLKIARTTEGLAALAVKMAAGPAWAGLAHTRWATHGAATEANAHPHATPDGRFALVLNGIVENDAELRRRLAARGVALATENDAETLVRWIELHEPGRDLHAAMTAALAGVTGNYAVVAVHADRPGQLACARRGSPLAVAPAAGGHYVVSDAAAVRAEIEEIYYLADGEVLVLGGGASPALAFQAIPPGFTAPDKAGYESFTLKEMHEQPEALARALAAALGRSLPQRGLDAAALRALDRVVLVGCGSAYLAGCAAKALIERHARLPAEAWVASEMRIADPLLGPRTLVVAVSQSGETADTLACVKLARAAGAPTLALANVDGSAIVRACDAFWPLACGTEVGVASTKAYTAMLLHLAFLAFELGTLRGTVPLAVCTELAHAARELPALAQRALAQLPHVERLAAASAHRRSFLFIGKHLFQQSACEGALKLRELAYVNAEGYAAGELKHGSIALIDDGHPVIAVAPRGPTAAKMASSLHEVRARGAHVIGIVTEGDADTAALCHDVVPIPATMEALTPILAAIPLQAFAYYVARTLGRPIDRPRNLAKSVTVE